ncbi:hypothetical protein GTY76_25940 [Streptomyces sp. SID4951]|nr:hypothetical protein [Streptomyces sp. SID4951]
MPRQRPPVHPGTQHRRHGPALPPPAPPHFPDGPRNRLRAHGQQRGRRVVRHHRPVRRTGRRGHRPGIGPDRTPFAATTFEVPVGSVLVLSNAPLLTAETPGGAGPLEEALARVDRPLQDLFDDIRYRTEVIVSELLTNAVHYGGSPLELRLVKDRTLTCEVTDGSPAAPHLRHARTVDEGGRGLFIVAQLAQDWGTRYRIQGKTVWAEQALPLMPEG